LLACVELEESLLNLINHFTLTSSGMFQLVNKCRWLSMDVLEACFPYNLVRTAYQHCYQQEADTFQ
ncbi:hypothetical protein ANCDUO_26844, partial [Ancylostoma duodenale]